jgi:hypothetical protein
MVFQNLPPKIQEQVCATATDYRFDGSTVVTIKFWNRHGVCIPINASVDVKGELPFDREHAIALCSMVYDLPTKDA